MIGHRPAPSRSRLVAVLFAAAAFLLGWVPVAPAGAVPAAGADRVQVSVVSVSPITPPSASGKATLTVVLELTNTTDINFAKVSIRGVRGDPIDNENALHAAISEPLPPDAADPQAVDITTTHHAVPTTLGPDESKTISFVTSTSTVNGSAGICLCENRIYPLFFEATVTTRTRGTVVLGSAQTFIPSFGTALPKPVQVSWVWPLLERPHRNMSDEVFSDDELAASIAGGRLDRLLQTVQFALDQDSALSMTLLVDPDLIDELAVMAAGPYKVETADGSTITGVGTNAAAEWLSRLRTVLAEDANLQLAVTPFADPDVRTLAENGIGWSQQPDAAARKRIATALGGHSTDTDISWPLGSSLDGTTLSALIRSGVRTVIVDDRTVPGSMRRSPTPDALAPVSTAAGTADLAITSSELQRTAADVVSSGGAGLSALPELVAQVAVRAEQDSSHSHYVVITPPRDADPDPAAASQAILATADASWSTSLSLGAAAAQVQPVRQGGLHPRALTQGLPARTVAAARYLAGALPTVNSLLAPAQSNSRAADGIPPAAVAAAAALVTGLPVAMQRAESAEWAADPGTSATVAGALQTEVRGLIDGVHLIKPTKGTYTLGSSDSPLPITIDNTLAVPVHVRVRVSTVGGLPGFTPKDVGVLELGPKSKLAVHIPAQVDRAGRIKVKVVLTTPADQNLGTSLQLSVRSTALGDVGKIITYGAGAILAAALLVRAGRQLRRRRRGTGARREPVRAR